MSIAGAAPVDDRAAPTDYDLLPYLSLPVAYTQPAHLAAIALLHGIELPPAEGARVLELGCASGGNIIPLAARFPQGAFTGIDLARRHVEEGRERVANLGLRNVDIQQADLASVDFGTQIFDFIICHGVFSWVPEAARTAILRLCGAHLAPNGAAVISYNVLPGWHLRNAIRDICLRFAGTQGAPAERVRIAREALGEIARSAPGNTPYAQMLRQEAERIARLPGSYVLGEFLAEHNHPLHFNAFMALAADHGLAFLSEATLGASAAAKRTMASAGRAEATEQQADYVTGRPFRRTILIRESAAGNIRRPVSRAPLDRLYVGLSPDGAARDTDSAEALPPRDAAAPATSWIMAQLAASAPSSLHIADLVRRGGADGVEAGTIRDGLLRLVMRDEADISTLPLVAGRADMGNPRLWPVALAEAANGQGWLSSLAHCAVPLPQPARALAPYVDGRRNVADLAAHTIEAVGKGALSFADIGLAQDQRSAPEIAAAASLAIARTIGFLAANALLAPDPA